jgi:hypothetical protein
VGGVEGRGAYIVDTPHMYCHHPVYYAENGSLIAWLHPTVAQHRTLLKRLLGTAVRLEGLTGRPEGIADLVAVDTTAKQKPEPVCPLREPTSAEAKLLELVAKVQKGTVDQQLAFDGYRIRLELRSAKNGTRRLLTVTTPGGDSVSTLPAVKRHLGLLPPAKPRGTQKENQGKKRPAHRERWAGDGSSGSGNDEDDDVMDDVDHLDAEEDQALLGFTMIQEIDDDDDVNCGGIQGDNESTNYDSNDYNSGFVMGLVQADNIEQMMHIEDVD